MTLIDLAAGGTPVDLEFAYTLSAQAKLVLTAHEIHLPKRKLAVEGPGGPYSRLGHCSSWTCAGLRANSFLRRSDGCPGNGAPDQGLGVLGSRLARS